MDSFQSTIESMMTTLIEKLKQQADNLNPDLDANHLTNLRQLRKKTILARRSMHEMNTDQFHELVTDLLPEIKDLIKKKTGKDIQTVDTKTETPL